MVEENSIDSKASKQIAFLQHRHLIIGWLGLLLFLSLGIVLETLHGFKVGFYLDVQNSSRRLMWTLAHTHGTLFSLIHIAFACSLGLLHDSRATSLSLTSKCLTGALLVMPVGFFAGGFWMYGGDPGLGVFLVPVGALLLLSGVAIFFITLSRDSKAERRQPAADPQKDREKQSKKSSRKRRRR